MLAAPPLSCARHEKQVWTNSIHSPLITGLVPAISIRDALRCLPKRDARVKHAHDEPSVCASNDWDTLTRLHANYSRTFAGFGFRPDLFLCHHSPRWHSTHSTPDNVG
jgi:hypothetical protein